MAKPKKPSLVHMGDEEAGFSRKAGRSGFTYYDPAGKIITHKDQDIKELFTSELKSELEDCELLALHLIRQK